MRITISFCWSLRKFLVSLNFGTWQVDTITLLLGPHLLLKYLNPFTRLDGCSSNPFNLPWASMKLLYLSTVSLTKPTATLTPACLGKEGKRKTERMWPLRRRGWEQKQPSLREQARFRIVHNREEFVATTHWTPYSGFFLSFFLNQMVWIVFL